MHLMKIYFDRKVDELDKAISVAARDPSWYGIDEAELEKTKEMDHHCSHSGTMSIAAFFFRVSLYYI